MLTAKQLQKDIGKYLKENSLENCQKIADNFEKFTRQHIARVNAVASFIGEHYPDHDADKFDSPFYYLLQYQHSGNKLEDTVRWVADVNKLITERFISTWTACYGTSTVICVCPTMTGTRKWTAKRPCTKRS